MLVLAHRAPVFATNTLVLAPGRGGPAVLVDPGAGVAGAVRASLAQHELTVAAVLLTHGHPDHLWDTTELAGAAPVHIGMADVERLTDPMSYLGPTLGAVFGAVTSWQAPHHVVPVADGQELRLAGLGLTAVSAPGHTPGSTVFRVDGAAQLSGPTFAEAGLSTHNGPLVLAGDVLFAGSIGRCDLPGGDERQMRATLTRLAGILPREAVVVPGHGPATTMAHELATNPFLTSVGRP